ncbi:hypothetical protein EYV94_15115 [Puteibacter caeruleilacunae]|nr:hypothetical protein EYV94_15115 [Puteibacter caeruleilacunae]
MKKLIMALVCIGFGYTVMAQTKAITQYGKTVILYENGTWKYESDVNKADVAVKEQPAVKVTQPEAPKAVAPKVEVKVDASKNVSSDKQQLFYTISPRLAKYFGEAKGKAKCDVSASNENGVIKLWFEWQVNVGEGNRYFGYLNEGKRITLHLLNGLNVDLFYGDGNIEKFLEKYNMSYYKGHCVVSQDQLKLLLNNPVLNVTMEWKKKDEKYEVEQTDLIMNALKEVM